MNNSANSSVVVSEAIDKIFLWEYNVKYIILWKYGDDGMSKSAIYHDSSEIVEKSQFGLFKDDSIKKWLERLKGNAPKISPCVYYNQSKVF